MTLAELIARKVAEGVATPEAATAAGIPEPSRIRMAREPLTVNGRPWRPNRQVGAQLCVWLAEPADVVVAAIRASHHHGAAR